MVSNIFYFHPYLGKIPIWTSIFFRWVVQPPTRKTCRLLRSTPHPVTVTTRIITFLVGNPNLNLHLPLLLGGGFNHHLVLDKILEISRISLAVSFLSVQILRFCISGSLPEASGEDAEGQEIWGRNLGGLRQFLVKPP